MTQTESPARPVLAHGDVAVAKRSPLPPAPPARSAPAWDVWPHTTRLLPWMIAGFLAMLWLIPFNTTMLRAGMPIDLQLDRIALPAMAVIWLLSLLLGDASAPRLRITPAHVAFLIFFLISALSVVVNARTLNITRELGDSIKQLSLLFAYLSFFVMITSIVRPQEVPRFLKYTLGLAVLCALGTIWEYHTHFNVFYAWTSQLPPALFSTLSQSNTAGVDEIGRPLTFGPTQHGLEVTAMLAMALPIAVVGLMQSNVRRDRILYGLAVCLLMAAAISTYRKSAIIAPVAAMIVILAFRPRGLVRLAPLAVVVLIVAHAFAPGALGSIVDQLRPNAFNSVSTVNDRKGDYDAVRPDVWTKPLLGRGYGAYSEGRYRILDNQLLGLLVMVGAIGLASFIAIMLTVIAAARAQIRSRDPLRAPPALIAASAAGAFLTISFLFDSMAFPHAPYVFLSLAGLAAACREPLARRPL